MKNLITAIFSVAVIGISTCSRKGLAETNKSGKEQYENLNDSVQLDPSRSNIATDTKRF